MSSTDEIHMLAAKLHCQLLPKKKKKKEKLQKPIAARDTSRTKSSAARPSKCALKKPDSSILHPGHNLRVTAVQMNPPLGTPVTTSDKRTAATEVHRRGGVEQQQKQQKLKN